MVQNLGSDAGKVSRGRRLDGLLAAYGEHHRNLINKAIHFIAVPLICWSIFAALAALPFPAGWRPWPWFGWATLAAVVAILYYFTFSRVVGIGVAASLVLYLALIAYVDYAFETPLWLIAVIVFAVAWAAQIIGHKIEGKRPKFLDDLRFLLIGPVWVLTALYRLFGIRY